MSALKLRIDKYLDIDELGAPRVPAQIYAIDPTGQSSSSSSMRRELVPISHKSTDAARLDLAPGTYYVEAILPSGETLADSVTLAEGETRELVLRAAHSSNEWFSWQDLMGNSRPTQHAPRPPRSKVTKAARKKSASVAGKGGSRRSTPSSRSHGIGFKSAATPRPSAVAPTHTASVAAVKAAIGRPIKLLSTPSPALVAGESEGGYVWKWLAEAISANAQSFVTLLNQGQSAVDLPAYDHNAERAVYRLSWRSSGKTGVYPLQGRIQPAPRYFAAVPRKRCVELICLPIPWEVIGSGREASIEIAIQQLHAADSFCAMATVRDEDLGMLLGFLSSGSLSIAREMTETAKDMLFGKMQNPYAAAAGGYAMVATALQAEDKDWHGWIRNLMSSFPHIPDGAIQWAQLRLRMRRSTSDLDEAKQALKLAYRRGLPFYSMGVKWLMEGLEWVARDDPEVDDMLRSVRRVAWITNLQQPFTILRIGGASDV